jgi:AcrR family transcriptional regulator
VLVAASDTRQRMIETAERLFAERGMGAVSLREVAAAAGQRNNSAAQYHFGSKEGLVEAVVRHRMQVADERRLEMLTDDERTGRATELRAAVEAMVVPLAGIVAAAPGPSTWARFLEQVYEWPELSSPASFDSVGRAGVRIMVGRVQRNLEHLPADVLERRLHWAGAAAIHALADHERDVAAGRPSSLDDVVDSLLDALVGLLSAPVAGPAVTLGAGAPGAAGGRR